MKTIKILHVEDDEATIELVKAMLKDKKYDIHIVRDGLEAIKTASSIFDIILMDIKLPKKNGREAAKFIKENFPKVPVVATTAYKFGIEGDDSIFDGYLRKPFTKNLLEEKIDKSIITKKNVLNAIMQALIFTIIGGTVGFLLKMLLELIF